MSKSLERFKNHIIEGYQNKKGQILLGAAILDKKVVEGAQVTAPLKTFNRHGLIAGATGTGKTKTLQIIAERLSEQGVPSLVMDMKGDLSGIATPGVINPKIEERQDRKSVV